MLYEVGRDRPNNDGHTGCGRIFVGIQLVVVWWEGTQLIRLNVGKRLCLNSSIFEIWEESSLGYMVVCWVALLDKFGTSYLRPNLLHMEKLVHFLYFFFCFLGGVMGLPLLMPP